MNAETDNVRRKAPSARPLDAFDRRILGVLVEDARLSYAEIGQVVGLSAPAVHERVRRLRAAGIVKRIQAAVDGHAVGKPLLAFVHVDAEGWGKSQRMMRLKDFPEVEEMHSVAGDTCVVLKVRTASPQAMEHFLSQLHVLPGIRGTKSYVVLSTYLERPVQADVTQDWPAVGLPPASPA
ncbi:MAG: AsnC family transcriptional regulator [Rhodospirillales bacterium]|nr:AsnC family transcriptional regulator [Rhodospirillales bacterium]